MRTARLLLIVLALACLTGAALPALAAADGCNNSAGDSQYIDPLQQCNPGGGTKSSSPGTTHTTPPPTTGTTAPTVSPTTTQVSSTTTTTPQTAAAADPSSSKSLPYTGFGVGTALIVACALLGGGFVLRRLATRSSH